MALLIKRRTLTKADGPALEILCQQYSRWLLCLKDIEEHGAFIDEVTPNGTHRVESPASKAATRLETSQRLMLKELSATPASRSRTKKMPVDPKTIPHKTGTVGWYKEQAAQETVEAVEAVEPSKPAPFEVSESECDFNAD